MQKSSANHCIDTATATAQATAYAACGTNNMVNSANGGQYIGLAGIDNGENANFATAPGNNALDCCVACQQTTNCAGSVFTDSGCVLIVANSCTPGSSESFFKTSSAVRPSSAFIVGNGPCGIISNDGSSG